MAPGRARGFNRAMATLELRGVGKTYPDGTEAVRDLDVTVEDGQLFVIVGPSGCGKSTVLRMIAGLEEVTTGDVVIDGVHVNAMGPRERDVAMAFQAYALYPHMTVAENIGFALKLAGMHSDELDRRVHAIARTLELSDVLERSPARLSGGQQQRVALGRSIIRAPRLLLMDEPLSNLDAHLRTEARYEILRTQRRLSTTTVYVTHDQTEAMALGDEVAVMRSGRVVQHGSPHDIYRRPVDVFVARFMGSPPMNILRARVAIQDGQAALEMGEQALRLDPAVLAETPELAALDRQHVAVGIRPESLHPDPSGQLAVGVMASEGLGGDRLVHATIDAPGVDVAGTEVVVSREWRSTITVRVPADAAISLWEPLVLGVDTSGICLFDLDTGKRIR